MGPGKLFTDPDPRASDDGALECEPAAEADGGEDQQPEVKLDADERVPEEAGYGYGV